MFSQSGGVFQILVGGFMDLNLSFDEQIQISGGNQTIAPVSLERLKKTVPLVFGAEQD